MYCHDHVNYNDKRMQALRPDQAELGARTSVVLLAAAALGRQLSVSLSLASQCHLLCQGGGHLHPHTTAGQEVSQKYACTGVFTIHTPLQVQGKWANITLSGCSNIVKISCFWFMLLVNLLSFIYFCFNEILFYFR